MELSNFKCSRCNKEYNSYNGLAKQEGYTLLRFWEYDIKNNRQQVVKRLLEYLK